MQYKLNLSSLRHCNQTRWETDAMRMSEEYRRRADEAELLAAIAMSDAHTARIREIARHWLEMAEEREHLLDPEHH